MPVAQTDSEWRGEKRDISATTRGLLAIEPRLTVEQERRLNELVGENADLFNWELSGEISRGLFTSHRPSRKAKGKDRQKKSRQRKRKCEHLTDEGKRPAKLARYTEPKGEQAQIPFYYRIVDRGGDDEVLGVIL